MDEEKTEIEQLKDRIETLEKENEELTRTNRIVSEVANSRLKSIGDLEVQAITLKDILTQQNAQ